MTEENQEIISKIAAIIKEARLNKGLTLVELEVSSGVNEGEISRIENGKKNFNVTTLVKLAKGLEIPLSKLLSKIN